LLLLASESLLAQTATGANSTTLVTHATCVDSTRQRLGMFVGDYRVQVAYRAGANGWDSSAALGHFAWDLGGCLMIERLESQRSGERYDYLALWGTSGPPNHRIQRVFAHSQHGLLGLSEGRWNDTNDTLVLADSAFVRDRWIQERLVVSRPRHGSFIMEGRRSEDGGRSWMVTHHAVYTATSPAPRVQEGFVTADDGIRLYYRVVGDGPGTVVIPGRLFLFHALQRLAPGRRLIFYDTRGRGKSDPVNDPRRETILDDVRDLEAVRRHFGAPRISLIGYSYMGLLVALYAKDYSQHVERVVQMGPVPFRFDATYPADLSQDYTSALDALAARRLDSLRQQGLDRGKPEEYCIQDWRVNRFALVGDPRHVGRIGVGERELCANPNEWPVNLDRHIDATVASIKVLTVTVSDLARISMPVLTIHGTLDRNAPYGGGREWAMRLPNARLLTIVAGAHQSFDEYPERVLPAISTFLEGNWPASAEKVTSLEPPAH
jgi:proline iminopeptidase